MSMKQKLAAVRAKSANGSGFVLEGMRAASINMGDAVPLTLVFRYIFLTALLDVSSHLLRGMRASRPAH